MTVKLYDDDAYMKSFEATVLDCEKAENGFKILLDKTAFFPEEGGQKCDSGRLNDESVFYVSLENENIYHYTKKPIPKGETVSGKIDFAKRFRNMQHHTGEHILSGLVNRIYGFSNVGFHLGEDVVTMDISGILTKEQIKEIEIKANEIVFARKEVKAYYPLPDELKNINYRSKLDLTENVRIVEIEDTDLCACCAPHVKNTVEIGTIKICDFMNWKGGMRFFIRCGLDAYKEYSVLKENASGISNLLSMPQDKIFEAVSKLKDEQESLKFEKSKILKDFYALTVEKTNDFLCVFDYDDTDAIRNAVNKGNEKFKIFVALLKNQDGYRYVIGSKSINLKELSKEINVSLSGKGGGTDTMIQGTFKATLDEIKNYFLKFKE